MLDRLLALLAPHHCYSCGLTGTLLCEKCKKHIMATSFRDCVVCGRPTTENNCQQHRLPYQQAYVVSPRQGVVARLLDDLKFQRVQAAAHTAAELLEARLPVLHPQTVIVPIPTIARHVRRRGYDHMKLIGRAISRRRRLPMRCLLRRRTNVTQHVAATAVQRRRQAQRFFRVVGQIDDQARYLIIDDIFTTGSTIKAAATVLRQAGARYVDIAVVARQEITHS